RSETFAIRGQGVKVIYQLPASLQKYESAVRRWCSLQLVRLDHHHPLPTKQVAQDWQRLLQSEKAEQFFDIINSIFPDIQLPTSERVSDVRQAMMESET